MFILMSWPDGTPLLIAGPCWPFCVGMTVPLVIGISFCVSLFVLVLSDDFVREGVLFVLCALFLPC